MSQKVISFLFTLVLIGWQIFDIVRGKASVFTWILLPIFCLGGLFELGAICEGKKSDAAENTAENTAEAK